MTSKLRALTLDDFLTLPLPKRIVWLHSANGPEGKLSHDKFAAVLGLPNRQTIIGWEKDGREPNKRNAQSLADFSGFPAWVFRRREAEEAAWEMFARRLGSLEGQNADLRGLVIRGFGALQKLLPQDQQPALEVPPSLAQLDQAKTP